MRTRAIPERLRGVFTTRRYTNTRLPLPYLFGVGLLKDEVDDDDDDDDDWYRDRRLRRWF